MSKLKVSIKKSTVTAMMKAGRKERINETELSQLARIKPCGIMHVTKTKKDSVIYTCPANINLTDRLKKAVSKYDFFFMIEQIVIMVEDVYNNGLNVNSVRFNMDDVYINEMTKEMYFIYFPIVGGQESADIVGFIENIIYTMTPVINEDTNYISRFMYYVRSFHGFNGNAIEKYISREERAVVNVLKNKAVTMQQTMQQQIMQQQTMQQQIMQQVMQGSMDGTTVLSDDGISVQQIQQMQPVNYHFASLTRQVTGEKIELGKPSFVLGKNPEKSDYAVADNTNISRVHAVITMRNGRYYVMDQNSTNGTFINGRIIKAGQETEILPGDCLMLAKGEENNTIMELKELSRRISRYRANVENLQLEKNRLLNEIDALDQEALKIKEYKWQAQNRFKCRVDNIAGMDRYSSRNITNLKGRLKSINSLNDGKSYVANAMNAIDSMLRDVENAIRSRNDRIYEINQQLCTYEDNIEQLRIKKRRMESK